MKEAPKNSRIVDWQVIVGIFFWACIIAGFTMLISAGRPQIPHAVLTIIEASAGSANLTLAHQGGDAVRFANTRCLWTPDVSAPGITEDAGSLMLSGTERTQGIVSKLESGEAGKLEKPVTMQQGLVGRLSIFDRMSGRPIFSQTLKITE